MLACSAESMMLDLDNNSSPLCPNSKQGQTNEGSYRPEVMGGGGVIIASLIKKIIMIIIKKQHLKRRAKQIREW